MVVLAPGAHGNWRGGELKQWTNTANCYRLLSSCQLYTKSIPDDRRSLSAYITEINTENILCYCIGGGNCHSQTAPAESSLLDFRSRHSSELRQHTGSCGVDSDFNNVPKPGYKHCDKQHKRQKFIQSSAGISKDPSMISFN